MHPIIIIAVAAIWDNRTVYHSAIFDFAGLGCRTGHRAVSIGERPYFDPNSKTRREALAEEGGMF
jgi:S-ribosylhomocysteine lyase LuxS involved in autoinducer biosynthesis